MSHPAVVLEVELGRGGFATVWRAQWMNSKVAVKVFTVRRPDDVTKVMNQFRLEAETLRTLRHPNICFFFDTCLVCGAPAIILELLCGGTLGQHLGLKKTAAEEVSADTAGEGACSAKLRTRLSNCWSTIPSNELLQLARDVASGLYYLHVSGVSHRDVKESNVMVDRGQTVRAKLCDFGISSLKTATNESLSRTFSSIGTCRYQAPELTRLMIEAPDKNIPCGMLDIVNDTRIDVYSYGLVLYEITHGSIAFGGLNGLAAMFMATVGERPPIAVVRPEFTPLGAVIEKCWDAEVERRPNMHEVLQALSSPMLETLHCP